MRALLTAIKSSKYSQTVSNIIRVYYELSKSISAHLINTFLSGVMLAGRRVRTRTHLKSSKFHGMRESTFRRGTKILVVKSRH